MRSFGDDPIEVGKYVQAAARGLTRAGIAPCAKHFPGHGDTHVDSHLALPIIQKTKAQLWETELVPFATLFRSSDNGDEDDGAVASIMTGHMALPLITGTNDPCSLSRAITTDLLRDEMGFKGLVVTDCLEMDAIANPAQGGCGIPEGAVRALSAGADVVMICHTFKEQVKAIEKTWDAVESGRLSFEEIKVSGGRVKEIKERFVMVSEERKFNEEKWEALKLVHDKISRGAYERSVAVINQGGLPLDAGKGNILLYTPELESINKAVDDAEGVLRGKGGQIRNTAGASFSALAKSIGARVGACQHVVYGKAGASTTMEGISAVVFVMRNADRATWQIDVLQEILGAAKGISLILVASCTPYDLVGVKGTEQAAYLACFEYTAAAFEAVTRVIFGEKEAQGRVPVKIQPRGPM